MLFEKAMEHILKVEGGYVNDPADRGGETNYGITKRLALTYGYTGPMKTIPPAVVRRIYRAEFWDKMRLDEIGEVSAELALELFDSAVNCGPAAPSQWLQVGLNALNLEASLFPNLAVDGRIGAVTIGSLKKLKAKDLWSLLKILNVLQGAHYLTLTERSESQERFIRGWLTRVSM